MSQREHSDQSGSGCMPRPREVESSLGKLQELNRFSMKLGKSSSKEDSVCRMSTTVIKKFQDR